MPEKSRPDTVAFSKEDRQRMFAAAISCYSRNDLESAEAILVGLVAIDDRDAGPLKLLGSTLLLRGRHIAAEAVYEKALAADPGDPYTLVALAEIKLKAMKLAEATKLFERLFRLDPDGKHPAANRGRELLRQTQQRVNKGV